ncbi:MAG: hypothetical protein WKF75_06820 [Singulisphaera sp.]
MAEISHPPHPPAWQGFTAQQAGAYGGRDRCMLTGAGMLGVTLHRVRTDRGELVIETTDPAVRVVVSQDGRRVTLLDEKTGRSSSVGKLRSGPGGKSSGLRLSAKAFTLKRGEQVIIRSGGNRRPGLTRPSRK